MNSNPASGQVPSFGSGGGFRPELHSRLSLLSLSVSLLLTLALSGCQSLKGPAVVATGVMPNPSRGISVSPSRSADHEPVGVAGSATDKVPTIRINPEMAARLQTFRVERASLKRSLRLSSTVQSVNSKTGFVTSLVHGVVTRVTVDVGDRVRRGQPLVYLNCPDLTEAKAAYFEHDAHLTEALANRQLVKTRVGVAQSDLERSRTLYQEGIAAFKDVQSAEARLAIVQSELQSAEAMVKANRSQLDAALSRLSGFGVDSDALNPGAMSTELSLRAPIGGVVSERLVQPGQSVGPPTAGSNSPPHLMVIHDLGKVWVMLEVPQSQVSSLELGARVKFETEVAPGRAFVGSITRLGEKFDPTSRTVSVRAEVDNPEGVLKPGMLLVAEVSVDGGERRGLVVPGSAIQELSDHAVVFRRSGPLGFDAVPVKVGARTSGMVEIESGLEVGDIVVSKGAFLLKSELVRGTIGGDA